MEATRPLKYEYRGNWKFQIENMSDNYHAAYVHASAFGPIGGYNFQAAWSTGWLAGHSV